MRTLLAACVSLVVFTACSVTQQAALKPAGHSGLVDYARLSPGGEGQAELRWVDPAAKWTTYHKVMVGPVTFWAGSDDAGISAEDQQTLCDFFYQALQKQFGQKFSVVDRPGPGVLRLQVALTDAEAATPGLRTVSMLIPQARVLATLKRLATGTYPFVGAAQVEARLSDAHSGTVLGEWADRRLGGGAFQTAAQWKWGDAENAINHWAAEAATKLASWTSGTVTP
jgi:hypothetical protein